MRFFKNLPVFFLFICAAQAQKTETVAPAMPLDKETKLISYSKVIPVDGTDKSELYNRALAWVNGAYKNPADVLREKNPEEGKILCKHRFKITDEPQKDGFAKDAGLVQYTLELNFKDGRYRYNLTELIWKQLSAYPAERWMDATAPGYSKNYVYYLVQADENVKKILAELEKAMLVNSKQEKKYDW